MNGLMSWIMGTMLMVFFMMLYISHFTNTSPSYIRPF